MTDELAGVVRRYRATRNPHIVQIQVPSRPDLAPAEWTIVVCNHCRAHLSRWRGIHNCPRCGEPFHPTEVAVVASSHGSPSFPAHSPGASAPHGHA